MPTNGRKLQESTPCHRRNGTAPGSLECQKIPRRGLLGHGQTTTQGQHVGQQGEWTLNSLRVGLHSRCARHSIRLVDHSVRRMQPACRCCRPCRISFRQGPCSIRAFRQSAPKTRSACMRNRPCSHASPACHSSSVLPLTPRSRSEVRRRARRRAPCSSSEASRKVNRRGEREGTGRVSWDSR